MITVRISGPGRDRLKGLIAHIINHELPNVQILYGVHPMGDIPPSPPGTEVRIVITKEPPEMKGPAR